LESAGAAGVLENVSRIRRLSARVEAPNTTYNTVVTSDNKTPVDKRYNMVTVSSLEVINLLSGNQFGSFAQ
jgi:hypothetical protein